jgi:hypothetical protein
VMVGDLRTFFRGLRALAVQIPAAPGALFSGGIRPSGHNGLLRSERFSPILCRHPEPWAWKMVVARLCGQSRDSAPRGACPRLLLGFFWDRLGSWLSAAKGIYAHPLSDLRPALPQKNLTLGNFLGNLRFLQTILCETFGSNGPLWSGSFALCLVGFTRCGSKNGRCKKVGESTLGARLTASASCSPELPRSRYSRSAAATSPFWSGSWPGECCAPNRSTLRFAKPAGRNFPASIQ